MTTVYVCVCGGGGGGGGGGCGVGGWGGGGGGLMLDWHGTKVIEGYCRFRNPCYFSVLLEFCFLSFLQMSILHINVTRTLSLCSNIALLGPLSGVRSNDDETFEMLSSIQPSLCHHCDHALTLITCSMSAIYHFWIPARGGPFLVSLTVNYEDLKGQIKWPRDTHKIRIDTYRTVG